MNQQIKNLKNVLSLFYLSIPSTEFSELGYNIEYKIKMIKFYCLANI